MFACETFCSLCLSRGDSVRVYLAALGLIQDRILENMIPSPPYIAGLCIGSHSIDVKNAASLFLWKQTFHVDVRKEGWRKAPVWTYFCSEYMHFSQKAINIMTWTGRQNEMRLWTPDPHWSPAQAWTLFWKAGGAWMVMSVQAWPAFSGAIQFCCI